MVPRLPLCRGAILLRTMAYAKRTATFGMGPVGRTDLPENAIRSRP